MAYEILFGSIVLPLAVAATLAGLARLLPARYAWTGSVAMLAGVLVAYGDARGWPALPPRSALEKLPYVIGIGAAALAAARPLADRLPAAALLGPLLIAAATLGWLLGARVLSLPLEAGVLWLAAVLGWVALPATGPRRPRALVMLIALALALAVIALTARTVTGAQLALGIAAASAGAVLAGTARSAPGALAGAATGLLVLTAVLLWFSEASWPALAIAWPVLLADIASSRLPFLLPGNERRRFVLLAVLPALAAGAVALAQNGWPGAGSP